VVRVSKKKDNDKDDASATVSQRQHGGTFDCNYYYYYRINDPRELVWHNISGTMELKKEASSDLSALW
jgi:hypothetical protein